MTLDTGIIPRTLFTATLGEPAYIVGSSVALAAYNLPPNGSDWDVFVPNEYMLGRVAGRLVQLGCTQPDRDSKIATRWGKFGVGRFHTNSVRFNTQAGVEINVVYKKLGGQPLRSLSQVLESFDFGHLAMGFNMELNTYHDQREYLFADYMERRFKAPFDPTGPLPLMPEKAEAWRAGLISQYNGIRMLARIVKHADYGFDMSLVTPDLVQGYREAALYWEGRPGTPAQEMEWQTLAQIYQTIALKLDTMDMVDLRSTVAQIDYTDSLDAIMEAVE